MGKLGVSRGETNAILRHGHTFVGTNELQKSMENDNLQHGSAASTKSSVLPCAQPDLKDRATNHLAVHAEFIYHDGRRHKEVLLCGEWVDWEPVRMRPEKGLSRNHLAISRSQRDSREFLGTPSHRERVYD